MKLQNIRICRSAFSKSFGLMFRRRQNLVMEFKNERKVSLHMFFVFFPIDVLILDKEKKIVEIKKDLKPWTFWSSSKIGKYAVEIGYSRTYEIGEIVKFDS